MCRGSGSRRPRYHCGHEITKTRKKFSGFVRRKSCREPLVDRLCGEPRDRHALAPALFAADDADITAGEVERCGEELDQRRVCGAFDRRRGQTHHECAVTLAADGILFRPGDHPDLEGDVVYPILPWSA